MSTVSPLIKRYLGTVDGGEPQNQVIVQLESVPAATLEQIVKYIYTGKCDTCT